MEFPDIHVFDESAEEADAGRELGRTLTDLGIESPFVVASIHGKALAAELDAADDAIVVPILGADQAWAVDVGAKAQRMGADAVVAIGGGRCLDVGKLAAGRAGVTVISVPTQLSHDGICSPVAVVPDETGHAESIPAIVPRAVFLSLPTLLGAPPASVAAGLGDLLANPLALRDWALAVERGIDAADHHAWDMSAQSFGLVEPFLDRDPATSMADPAFLRTLADALILSGMAMIQAGTSRPASGGEHEISHAIDELYGGRALHGAQVAFGCTVSVHLYGEDHGLFRERLRRLGLPQHPRDLGLTLDDAVRVLLHAPETRPGRYTIIEAAGLDEAAARSVIRTIWDES
ncbi:MAG TPA: iron-containing alcohol dehydrogenase [Actinomycetota bacterium]|nr:iron-containing alcohol dehydrogenase [Actinomycetota bacterium]